MLRLSLFPILAFAIVLSGRESARADVVIGSPSDSSSQTVIKTTPSTVIVVKQQTPTPPPPPPPPKDDRKFGLHVDFGGTFGPDVLMGGFMGALRFRPKERFGIDLGSGYFAGTDYQGFNRTEIPITANALFFINPQHKLQLYFLVGPGVSIGHVDTVNEVRRMIHIGGQAGMGLELRLAKAFALNADVRGILRYRVDRDPRPEFFDGTRSTDFSGGAMLTFGATFYF